MVWVRMHWNIRHGCFGSPTHSMHFLMGHSATWHLKHGTYVVPIRHLEQVELVEFKLGTAPPQYNWIIILIWLYMALNRTPDIGCYWGQHPKFKV